MEPKDWLELAEWLIGGLLCCLGYLYLMNQKDRDRRINQVVTDRETDRAEFRTSLKQIVDNFTAENRETRSEFKDAVSVLTTGLKEATSSVNQLQLVLTERYATFDDLRDHKTDIDKLREDFQTCQRSHLKTC